MFSRDSFIHSTTTECVVMVDILMHAFACKGEDDTSPISNL